MEKKIYSVLNEMSDYLNAWQMKQLQKTLIAHFAENNSQIENESNDEYLRMFIEAKKRR